MTYKSNTGATVRALITMDELTDIAATVKAIDSISWTSGRDDLDAVLGRLRRSHGEKAMNHALDLSTLPLSMRGEIIDRQVSMVKSGS